MDAHKKPCNPLLILVLVGIALDWLGVFAWIEEASAKGQMVEARVSPTKCVTGRGEDFGLTDCEQFDFYDLDSGQLVEASCARACKKQIALAISGEHYRLLISNLPFLGRRIVDIEHYGE